MAKKSKWSQTLIAKMGEEGYRQWLTEKGKKGGTRSRGGGFASDKVGSDGLTGKERAALVGKIGGSKKRI